MATPPLIEQKFFLRWTNFILYPDFQITNLLDLKDGFLLLKMTELFLSIPEEDSESILLNDFNPSFSSTTNTISSPGGKTTTSHKSSMIKNMQAWAQYNIDHVFNNCKRMNALVKNIDPLSIFEGKINAIVEILSAIATALHVQEITFQGVAGELALLQWARELCVGLVPKGISGFGGRL
jgi:hypothetical protein